MCWQYAQFDFNDEFFFQKMLIEFNNRDDENTICEYKNFLTFVDIMIKMNWNRKLRLKNFRSIQTITRMNKRLNIQFMLYICWFQIQNFQLQTTFDAFSIAFNNDEIAQTIVCSNACFAYVNMIQIFFEFEHAFFKKFSIKFHYENAQTIVHLKFITNVC